MRPKTLLVLSLAALALGAFIFFYEKDLPSTDERAELAKKVLRFEADEVDALLIEWGDRQVRLERQRPDGGDEDKGDDDVPASGSDDWRIVAPLAARADRGAVDGLVSSLANLESSRSIEGFDRAELGFDEPRARVTVIARDGQSVLEVGAELPASSDMVVTVAGGAKAYQVGASLYEDLTKDPGDWRDKKLFPGARGDVERLSWTPPGGEKTLLAKRGDDFWIEAPLTDRADEDLVNTLLSELTGLRAETFVDEPLLTPEGMGLEPPQSAIEVVLGGREQPFRLELGATAGDGDVVYGRADSQLFEVKTELPESLAATAGDWRSKSWTNLQVFEVETARFESDAGVVEVRRDGADWLRGEDRVSYTTVSDLLYPITDAEGDQVIDPGAASAAGHALDQPALTVTLSTKDDDEAVAAEQLSLFPAVDGVSAATSGGRDAVLLLAEETAGEILEKLQALRDAEPLPGDGDEPESEAPETEE